MLTEDSRGRLAVLSLNELSMKLGATQTEAALDSLLAASQGGSYNSEDAYQRREERIQVSDRLLVSLTNDRDRALQF